MLSPVCPGRGVSVSRELSRRFRLERLIWFVWGWSCLGLDWERGACCTVAVGSVGCS
jgi:hypothetical protein